MSTPKKPTAADVSLLAAALEGANAIARERGLYIGDCTISGVPLSVLDELAGPHYDVYPDPQAPRRYHIFRSRVNDQPRLVGRYSAYVSLRADRDDELAELEACLSTHEAQQAEGPSQ